MMYDTHAELSPQCEFLDPFDPTRMQKSKPGMSYKDLLIPVMRKGKRVYDSPSLESIRSKTIQELGRFPSTMRRFLNPEPYFVGMEKSLYDMKLQLIQELRK